ncbi:MAG: hypothetical protein KatS3mg092_0617 [Patescibacteria group bacterium]|nr:MAG: hypothetical protein KatS3mg092_0617 [Patescibacteria group bacterium]
MEKKNLLFNLADNITKKTFKLTLDFPQKFQYSLGDQLRRSCLSIVLNIVEGGARLSQKEKKQFLNIAFGSLKETKYLLYFSNDLRLIKKEDFEKLVDEINHLAKLIYGLLYKK